MNQREINIFLERQSDTQDRNIVIIDFSNVDRWERSLGWPIGIKELSHLVKHLSVGHKYLRRFYYGEDYGPSNNSTRMKPWSKMVHEKAGAYGFEIITKRVKYIPDPNYKTGYLSKCNLDVEMAVDLVKDSGQYDKIFLFSGDGDMAYVLRYLQEALGKSSIIFCARDHLGKELIDAHRDGIIEKICFVEDFEYRLKRR